MVSGPARILSIVCGAIAVVAVTAACGTERIGVPSANAALHHGAVIFSQRCAGCHTLSYAGTHGSAPNVRTALAISGPNFDQRCERPEVRVLYAIENGGFSGAYMPQNIVVGQDAVDVARFVATYSGRKAPFQIGVPICQRRSVGTLPPVYGADNAGAVALPASAASSSSSKSAATPASGASKAGGHAPSGASAHAKARSRRRRGKAKS